MKKNLLCTLIFSIIGMLFAGYLTISKILLGYCPLTEPCPVLWGYPVCVYGLIFFITLFVTTLALNGNLKDVFATRLLLYTSILATLFALFFAYQELFIIQCPGGVCRYSLGIPTCIYGLVMYLIILYNAARLQ